MIWRKWEIVFPRNDSNEVVIGPFWTSIGALSQGNFYAQAFGTYHLRRVKK